MDYFVGMKTTRNMVPTRITKREARARLLVATSLREFPGGADVFGETVAAAIAKPGAQIVAFGDGSMVVKPNASDPLRFVVE